MKAIWNDQVIADSEHTELVEGNHYFPADAIDKRYFQASDTTSFCPWKGEASYYNIVVDDAVNKDAAWYYPAAKEKAHHIQGMVAFWRGVQLVA